MRAVFLTVTLAVTALRFSQRNAYLKKVADFEANTVAYQKSRSDLVDAIVTDFEASTVAYQKSQPDSDPGNLSAVLASAEQALTPQEDDHKFDENKFLDEVYREAQEDEKAEAASKATLLNASTLSSRLEAAHSMFLHAREQENALKADLAENDLLADGDGTAAASDGAPGDGSDGAALTPSAAQSGEGTPPKKHKAHVLKKLRQHTRARTHSMTVDLPDVPGQPADVCDPGITVCLPCDGTDDSDTSLIPRVLQSIADQTCRPSKVILAVSGISEKQAAAMLEELGTPDYRELFPFETLASETRLNAGLNRNRCAKAADTEVVSFFDVDDIMHPRRLELLSFEFGNNHPHAVVHAYEESPKYLCEERATSFLHKSFGSTLQIFDGVGIYDLSMTPDADKKNSLRTPNSQGLNHAGHISVLRSVFAEVQQSNLARGQDAKFARDILRHFGRNEDTMACLNVPLTLYCHKSTIIWH